MSDNSKNVLMRKTKVILTLNDFDISDTKKRFYKTINLKIGSNECEIIIVVDASSPRFSFKLNSEKELFVSIDAFIYDSNMKKNVTYFDQNLVKLCKSRNFFSYDFPFVTTQEFLPQKDILFADNTLIIGLIITVVSKDIYKCIPRGFGYRNTFNVKEFNDLHIICGLKELFFSKAVLISHSEVFEKMLTIDMRELKNNQLIIEDIDGEVFEEFLKFIYFGNTDKLDDLKEELLFVADKYLVLDLKEICENLMFIEINTLNAIKLLLTFDKYNCIETLEKTIDFISKDLLKVKEKTQNEWRDLMIIHNHLIDRITDRMAKVIKVRSFEDNNCVNSYTFYYIN